MIDDPLNRLKVKRGEDLPHAKLTEASVIEIRATVDQRNALRAQLKGMTNKALAAKHNVHERTIDRITAEENWTHV